MVLTACCGIDCETCDARLATLADDEELRKRTAEEWAKKYQYPFTPADIHCTGCRAEGLKIGHCGECAVRLCAMKTGVKHCGECATSPCATLDGFHAILSPEEAKEFKKRLGR